jgi:hypothetical protein
MLLGLNQEKLEQLEEKKMYQEEKEPDAENEIIKREE